MTHRADTILPPLAELRALLRLLAGVDGGASAAARVSGWGEGDWRWRVMFCRRHGLLPLLGWRLTALEEDGAVLPGPLRRKAREWRTATWLANERKLAAWREIGAALENAGIEVMALKGLYYGAHLYPDPACRPMADLDLMVRPGDVDRLTHILAGLGYEAHPLNAPGRKELWFDHRERRIHLDVHLGIVPTHGAYALPAEELWRRSAAVDLHGVAARVLAPDDQMLQFALHGTVEHLLQPLRILLDLQFALDRWGAELDGPALLARARQAGVERALRAALAVADRVFGLPGEVRGWWPGATSDDDAFARWVLRDALALRERDLGTLIAAQPLLLRISAGRARRRGNGSSIETNRPSPLARVRRLARSMRLAGAAGAGIAWLLLQAPARRRAALAGMHFQLRFHRPERRGEA